MSEFLPENQAGPHNPYTPPVSAASPVIKSYLTLAVCSSLVVAAVLGGIWMYARSSSPGIMDRGEIGHEAVTVRPYVNQQDAYSEYAKGMVPQPRSRVNDYLSKEPSSKQAEPVAAP